MSKADKELCGSRQDFQVVEVGDEYPDNQPVVEIIPPKVIASDGRYGDKQVLEGVVLSFERDIEIFYGKHEAGEHVAILPIKVTYRRKTS